MAKIKLSPSPYPQVSVVTPGTAVPLANTSTELPYVVIQALPGNVGPVYIGDVGVQSDLGLEIQPGQSIKLAVEDSMADEDKVVIDLADWYVDAVNAGDKVNIMALVLTSVTYGG